MKFVKKYFVYLIILVVGGVMFFPRITQAVVPPDFIFNIGSQIAQIFSVAVVFLSAIFVTSYQFIKTKFATLKARRIFWIISIICILVASLIGAVLYSVHKQNNLYARWVGWFQRSGQRDKNQKQQYLYDRIIVSGRDKENKPLLILFEGSRQELKNYLFGHSYTVNILYKDRVYSDYALFNSSSSSIQTHKFITHFSHLTTPELPIEAYEFSLYLKDKRFALSLSDLNGDFLIKNRLDYLRYVSSGKARVEIESESIEGRVMVDRVLSEDAAVPTLQGYNPKYMSHSIALWDEEGNFYHLDKSEVFTPNIPYASHTWVLYKNNQGESKKIYEAEVNFNQEGDAPLWKINIPLLNTELNFRLNTFLKEGRNNFIGFVEGKVVVGGRERNISGYALFENNR